MRNRKKGARPRKKSVAREQSTSREATSFSIVGIGASAGGLEAATELLNHLPADTGMAFVFIQHLAPQHPSMMADLLARQTRMPVAEAADGMMVEPNHIYIIPPNANLGIFQRKLQVLKVIDRHAPHMPINYFFNSLAQDQQHRAIGVVLSGSASDGALGLKAIKAEGGITFAQNVESAAYPSMPQSAVAAGAVDFVLTPEGIAKELMRQAHLPIAGAETLLPEDSMSRILYLVKQQTGHDFTYYKPSTIERRVRRRMQLHRLQEIGDYVQYLDHSTNEVQALYEDLLIHVTSFFRDPDAYEALRREVFPHFLQTPPRATPIRIWVPACSTGEEAYSIAILLTEFLESVHALQTPFQLFASDIDVRAIETARLGIYPESIAHDISQARLARFFTKTPDGYQVHRSIRSVCVFATQDIARDPPFAHIDLISCRNLLIYLTTELQQKMVSLFHYALNQDGYLFLGASETVSNNFFATVDPKHKIYQRKGVETHVHYPFVPAPPVEPAVPAVHVQREHRTRQPQQVAEELLLSEFSLPALILDDQMEVTGFSGHTSPFIEPPHGSASLKLLRMLRADMAMAVRAVVRKAIESNTRVREEGVCYQDRGEERRVDITVTPLPGRWPGQRYYLLVFEPVTAPSMPAAAPPTEGATRPKDQQIQTLRQELANNRHQMQTIIDEQATYNEELQAANEEIRSSNEELQSTNEELESAKEELQSMNEEMSTLNSELATRNADLAASNSDLSNLLNSAQTPIVMLSSDFTLRHFTPAARPLFNLIDSDLGRPLGHLKATFEFPDLERNIREVIATGEPRKVEIRDDKGHTYSLQIMPYLADRQHVGGAVLVFIDLTEFELKRARDARFAAIVRDSNDAVVLYDLEGRILAWNRGAERMYGYSEAEALTMNIDTLVLPALKADVRGALERARRGEPAAPFETQRQARDGRVLDVWLTQSVLRDRDGKTSAIATTERDITELKRALERAQQLGAVLGGSNDAVVIYDTEGRILAWNRRAEDLYGYKEDEALRMNVNQLLPDRARDQAARVLERLRRGEHVERIDTQRLTKAHALVDVSQTASVILRPDGMPNVVVSTERATGPAP